MTAASTQFSNRQPIFGLNITSNNLGLAFKLAKGAEDLGLDIIGIQDHPYNGTYFDTWALIGALSASTKKLRFFANVSDLPMRPPAMLAKISGTLDLISVGRIELGIGAGAYWDAISAYGSPRRAPGEAVVALEEAIQVIRLLWNYNGLRKRVSFPGKYYHLQNAQAGPSPRHDIAIWIGAFKPKMLDLIGRIGDGWVIPLSSFISADEIRVSQKIIDDAATKNARFFARVDLSNFQCRRPHQRKRRSRSKQVFKRKDSFCGFPFPVGRLDCFIIQAFRG